MPSIELGRVLRAARVGRDLSVRDAAALSGLAKSHYQRLEAGQVGRPTPDVLRRLSGALGVRYEALLAAAGYL